MKRALGWATASIPAAIVGYIVTLLLTHPGPWLATLL